MAWDQHLIAEPEGPSSISRTVARRGYSRDARDTRPTTEVAGPCSGVKTFAIDP